MHSHLASLQPGRLPWADWESLGLCLRPKFRVGTGIGTEVRGSRSWGMGAVSHAWGHWQSDNEI